MNRTQLILKELLDAVEQGDGIDAVMARHGGSKSPMYAALLEATQIVHKRLGAAQRELDATVARVTAMNKDAEQLEQHVRALNQQVTEAEGKLPTLKEEAEAKQALLDQVGALEARGFTTEHLSKLGDLLGEIAASEGLPAAEGVTQFFQTVKGFERAVSLDLEVKAAKVRAQQANAEAAYWQAEAKRRETQSKARIETIETLEHLLANGLKEADLVSWAQIAAKSGISVPQIAKALGRYANFESAARAAAQNERQWRTEVTKLKGQVSALKRERGNAQAAIRLVRTKAEQQVELMAAAAVEAIQEAAGDARAAVDEIAAAGANYGSLREEAAMLRE